MRISLIDIDSKISNLALMKLSAYHKNKGDVVGLNLKNPDKIYTSIVFRKNKNKAKNQTLFNIKKEFGGSGYDIKKKLPDKIELLKPDYDLYPSEYSQGFTTRGCIRNCYFCNIREKEGKFKIWQHPKEFYDDRFNSIMLMDNNILANKNWFIKVAKWLIDQDLILLENGLDIRLVDEEVLKYLTKLKIKILHFAFDFTKLEPIIREKIKLLQDWGIDTKNKTDFYVYCHSDEAFNDALYRINVLRSLNTSAFFMYNCDNKKTRRILDLSKWCNRKMLYWKIPFEEYNRGLHK